MAPECESGTDEEITIKSDLYSAGKLLWSAITNRFAFAREESVFNKNSMNSLFPDLPEIWHLYHFFEKTIRKEQKNRFKNVDDAIQLTKKINNLIKENYYPLELAQQICPVCGMDKMKEFRLFNNLYNPNKNAGGFECENCGLLLHFNRETKQNNLDKRKNLD